VRASEFDFRFPLPYSLPPGTLYLTIVKNAISLIPHEVDFLLTLERVAALEFNRTYSIRRSRRKRSSRRSRRSNPKITQHSPRETPFRIQTVLAGFLSVLASHDRKSVDRAASAAVPIDRLTSSLGKFDTLAKSDRP
jgi:hypothetical protein